MNDETAIRKALAEWAEAFRAKEVERLLALYSPDAVLFDAIPPFTSGVEAMRGKLDQCFPFFPDDFQIEIRDLATHIDGNLASAHFLWHFTGLPPGHPAGAHWLRSSIVWQRQAGGDWRIVHDHCSAPFDPYTEKVVLSPDSPATANLPPEGCRHNPVGWFEIYVQDMERAKAFYSAVLGYSFTRLDSPIELWAFPMQPGGHGAAGALAHIEGFRSADNSILVYFTCDDCAAAAAKALAAGGQVHKPRMSIGQYGYIELIIDSEGNMIGLHSMK